MLGFAVGAITMFYIKYDNMDEVLSKEVECGDGEHRHWSQTES